MAILLLALIPLWRLTHKAGVAMNTTPVAATAAAPVHVELTFSHPASGFQLLHLGKVIWEGKDPGEMAQKDFAMAFPKEGIDLELKAEWPAAAPLSAVRVSVTHAGNASDKTAWGRGTLDEVLTFNNP